MLNVGDQEIGLIQKLNWKLGVPISNSKMWKFRLLRRSLIPTAYWKRLKIIQAMSKSQLAAVKQSKKWSNG